MISPDAIGYAAGVINMTHLIPQIMKSYKSGSTTDISLNYAIIHTVGLALWTVYGIAIQSYPVIIMHFIETLFAASILVLKLKNG